MNKPRTEVDTLNTCCFVLFKKKPSCISQKYIMVNLLGYEHTQLQNLNIVSQQNLAGNILVQNINKALAFSGIWLKYS